MTPERFEHLLGLVGGLLQKQNTNFKKSISPAEHLTLTLRYLATGDSQQTIYISYVFRIGKATVSKIVPKTCNAIYIHGFKRYLFNDS